VSRYKKLLGYENSYTQYQDNYNHEQYIVALRN